jgi:hypothetical protein
MRVVRASNRCGGRFREPEKPHLPRRHEFAHRSDRLFDRHLRIDAVLVVQVDRLDPQPLQARLTGLTHVCGRAVDAEEFAVRSTDVSELRREHDGFAAIRDRFADQLFVRPGPVHIGRIEKRDPEIDRTVDRSDRFRLVAVAVEFRHAHAAEAERRDDEAAATEFTLFHASSLPS